MKERKHINLVGNGSVSKKSKKIKKGGKSKGRRSSSQGKSRTKARGSK